MKYINTVTKNIIETNCECFGGDWELFEEAPSLPEVEAVEETEAEEVEAVEETEAEEVEAVEEPAEDEKKTKKKAVKKNGK